jgi:uncharacterized protein YjbJ (UPF0337 family)
MHLHIIEGDWQQAEGRIQEEWGAEALNNLVVLIGKDDGDRQVVDIESLFASERQG